ncbi:hypothetical protein F4779DRAFT_445368 [Xylariaceae sp. FL0662B]|nr:hypothetical protein F4779DRAFT_445368 [Xylariaceae sp. FL0662B]
MSSNVTSPATTSSPPATTAATTSTPTTTASETPPTTTSLPPTSTTPTTSSAPPPSTETSTSPSSSTTSSPPTSSTTSNSPTSTPTTTSTTPSPTTSSSIFTTTELTTGSNGSTAFVTVTSTEVDTNTVAPTSDASSTTAGGALITSSATSSPALAEPAKIAVAVVVPIAAVAILVIAGIFFWRRRKQRKDAEEERRKEVEDYSYNPNNDPTLPDVGGAAGTYEMKEDGSSGYRGWGSTTLGGSTGRKASTTMSGGAAGAVYSDAVSPTRGNFSDTRSGDALMGDGSHSPPEGEILGAMGPSGTNNRDDNVHRGPSNASSYSAAGRSDGSAENGAGYGGPAYLDQYGGNNPYGDGAYGQQRSGESGGQPVIRDNPARRNTPRIENLSHYPQQSAGISQNF